MPSFGVQEMLLIGGIIVLLFGAKRLPEIARSMGKAKNEFKRGLQEGEAEGSQVSDEPEVRKADELRKAETSE